MTSGDEEMMSADATDSPPYSELIIEAITKLNEQNGSSEAAISKQIESVHTNLPSDHSSLLGQYLRSLTELGRLVVVDEAYKLRRGRGRPPKPKTDQPAVKGPARPRGRPPKPKDPTVANAVKVPRPRGRPPKQGRSKGVRPRGRPSKAKTAALAPGATVRVSNE